MYRWDFGFGKIWGASGVQGFFGEGYRHHDHLNLVGLGPKFVGMTFVAKTATLPPNKGNMALQGDFTPRDIKPDCIYVDWLRCDAVNAVGLSNPGIRALLDTDRWQKRKESFLLSYMPLQQATEDMMHETRQFVDILEKRLQDFRGHVGVQINLSCPTTKHNLSKLLREADEIFSICERLNAPLFAKINALVAVEAARELSQHSACNGICVSNTIPYGELPEWIPWGKIFGGRSPLKQYGGGGYSGRYLLPITVDWIKRARKCGVKTLINGGGGILSVADARKVFSAGADSISLGSVTFFRPWRTQGIIDAING
jgi:dihydroorotate dehydrogenase (NAD+) catalytic subunit